MKTNQCRGNKAANDPVCQHYGKKRCICTECRVKESRPYYKPLRP